MKHDFLTYQAQTTPHPLGMVVSRAAGCYVYDENNVGHLDFVAGVSACSLGHCHPEVIAAVKDQCERYMHVMVYGEYVQSPAVRYTKLLASLLPEPLQTTYLVNSGTEAIEAAIKLARRVTGRSEIIAAQTAYHGNTMGSLSLMDLEGRKAPFRPLLPGIKFMKFNDFEAVGRITEHTAAVVLETIQGGAGFIMPKPGFLEKVRAKCTQEGALLILDEIQPGFGRTGTLFAFQQFNCIPDILVIGKGMASGLPCGALVASHDHMSQLSDNPKLGHITTFGGNPVIAAASLATLTTLTNSAIMKEIAAKEKHFRSLLVHPLIKEIRGTGLMLALILESGRHADELVLRAAKNRLILFWLLFEPRAVRITPPLVISIDEITLGCQKILAILDDIHQNC